ncbi:MAG: hypothetical protein V5A84_02245 [Planctomycetota bacterium]
MSDHPNLLEPWEPITLEAGQTRLWQIGPLKLYIHRSGHEWHLATEEVREQEDGLAVAGEAEPGEDIQWRRWANPGGEDRLRLAPLMPDRPVVVRPKAPLAFPPGAGGTLYARIPVWVQLNVGGEDHEVTLCEVPSITLSNTWFGPDTTEGELCYSMASTLVSELESVNPAPHRAICALHLQNEAEEPLNLERMCIRGQQISVSGLDGCLWTSEVTVTYRDPAEPSRVEYSDKRFRKDENAKELTPPRNPITGGLVARSFARVASIGNLF